MNKIFTLLAAAAVLLVIGSPAFAEDVPPVQSIPTFDSIQFDVGLGALFAGGGEGSAIGENIGVKFEQTGESGNNLVFGAGGSLCGTSCADAGYTADAFANQYTIGKSFAESFNPEQPVLVGLSGISQTAISFTLQKTAPASTAGQ